ncbi:hypothetical protein [Fodinicola feengrottensis]
MSFIEKNLTSPGVVVVAGRSIKRYHVRAEGVALEPAVEEAAYACLPQLLADVDETPPAAFTVLHRSSNAAYLNVYSWVWDNVIEYHNVAAGIPFLGCPDEDPTNFVPVRKPWIGCVWELPPLEHERSSWVRHLLKPEIPDLAGYLADLFPAGPIGS